MASKHLMTSLLAASAFALVGNGAHAATYILNLTASGGVFSSSDNGGVHTDRYDFTPTGIDPLAPLSVQVGDEIVLNVSITDGPYSLPPAAIASVFSFYLTGDGFPSGDSATHGVVSVFDGGNLVESDSETTTTSAGVASDGVFYPATPTVFDQVTTDFFIDTIDGSNNPGTFGTIDQAYLSADSRNPSVVPEPAAWALMLLGFGGLGAALRTRRRGDAAAA